jgi:hypothetical protein
MAFYSSPVFKWIGGILTPVLTAVLIYYLTRPKPQALAIDVEGRAVDISRAPTSLVAGATVKLEAGTFSGIQVTDNEGRYVFEIDNLPGTTPATFSIDAEGFQHFAVNKTLEQLSNTDEGQLAEEIATIPAGGNGGGKGVAIGTIVASLHAKSVAGTPAATNPSLPRYVRRAEIVKIGPAAQK